MWLYSDVLWEMNWLKRILGAEVPGVVVIQSRQFPSLGANHDLGDNQPSTLQGKTQRLHAWSGSQKADFRANKIKEKNVCVQDLPVYFSGICLAKK